MRSIDPISQMADATLADDDLGNYDVCLEDLQLFAQLEDLSGERLPMEMELLNPGSEYDLLELVNGVG